MNLESIEVFVLFDWEGVKTQQTRRELL